MAPLKRNDFHHLRHACIHRFTMPSCRTSGYVTGTTLARMNRREVAIWILRIVFSVDYGQVTFVEDVLV